MKKGTMAVGGLVAVMIGAYLLTGNTATEETSKQQMPEMKQLVQDLSTRKATAQSASITEFFERESPLL
ncbi:hypothetical protein [Paenibacillus donghaensis]|uniref:Uncharacterized protein n=1 Tax=Paenibacillus donghaensis TaxID=414771 RepID=A0A2Z2KJT7_9BACL|nr:hypothetical protein [Paenibacillus donghaensis]ASA21212.1 hypothetical protein B9T62_10690 [Paenibacillus donghaensis]